MFKKPVLVLDDAPIERACIVIGGQSYDLLDPEEVQLPELRKIGKAAGFVFAPPADTSQEDAAIELDRLLDDCVKAVLVAPAEVRARLGWQQKLRIMTAYTEHLKSLRTEASPEAPAPAEQEAR